MNFSFIVIELFINFLFFANMPKTNNSLKT